METLVIGDGSLTIHEVAQVLEKSASFAALQSDWKIIAHDLHIPRELLSKWKAAKGSGATLQVLQDVLVDRNLVDIAEELRTKFCKPEKTKSLKVFLQGTEFDFQKPEDMRQDVFDDLGQNVLDNPQDLIRNELFPKEKLKYYIPRSLLYRSELSNEIFTASSTKDHIFLVKGVRKYELACITNFKPIEESRNQLEKVTVQFILLDCDDDYEIISKITTKPVHFINCKNNSFFWMKSSKKLNVIQDFLKSEPSEVISEEEAASRITSKTTGSFHITDTPGMGKTTTLASLARRVKECTSNALVLFVTLVEFAQHLHQMDGNYSTIEVILTYATNTNWAKTIVREIWNQCLFKIYLFLDGYDEVLQDMVGLIDKFLHNLKNTSSITVIVTSRSHLNSELGNLLNQLSFQIQPFAESNQIDFLTKYWSSQYFAEESESLTAFAVQCLEKLKVNMTDKERSIAGTPLQCMLLAEAYSKDATRASRLSQVSDVLVKEISVFKIYQLHVEEKFNSVRHTDEYLMQAYRDAHVYDAIRLLFPNWLEIFKPYLSQRGIADENTIYSIGLIEKNPFSSTPMFVHRTFAEYLIADFVVKGLKKYPIFLRFFVQEIFRLKESSRVKIQGVFVPTTFTLNQKVITYFVNMQVINRFCKHEMNEFALFKNIRLRHVGIMNICVTAAICCHEDLENCFDLLAKILYYSKIKFRLQYTYFRFLPQLVISKTDNYSLLKKVLEFVQIKFGYHLSHPFFETIPFNDLEFSRPIDMAVYLGKYNFTIYLLENYQNTAKIIKRLLHACVRNSANNNDAVIENKLAIIEVLLKLDKEWQREETLMSPILQQFAHIKLIQRLVGSGEDMNAYHPEYGTVLHQGGGINSYLDLVTWALNNGYYLINSVDYLKRTPLFAAVVKFKTVSYEVLNLFHKAGVNFDSQDGDGNPVLFYALSTSERWVVVKSASKASKSERINNKRNLLNTRRERSETAERVERVTEVYSREDPEHRNPYPLFRTTWCQSRPQLVHNLLNFGANPNLVNNRQENAAHCIIRSYEHHSYSDFALRMLELLESRGFRGFNQKDVDGNTPLDLAIKMGIKDEEPLEFLKNRDFNYRLNRRGPILVVTLLLPLIYYLRFT